MHYLGQDVNAQDSHQETAMHWAARGGQTDTLKRLVNVCRAQPAVKSSRGHTPLQVAEECDAREAVHELRALVRKAHSTRITQGVIRRDTCPVQSLLNPFRWPDERIKKFVSFHILSF